MFNSPENINTKFVSFLSFPSEKDPDWRLRNYKNKEEKDGEEKDGEEKDGEESDSEESDSDEGYRYANAVIISYLPYDLFKMWNQQKCNKRDIDYQIYKTNIASNLIKNSILKHYPQLENNIDKVIIGTPLTNSHYLNTEYGECYGLEHTPDRYISNIQVDMPLENLFLTGQDIVSCGFYGAFAGGLVSAHKILGYGTLEDIITGRNLIDDLSNVDV